MKRAVKKLKVILSIVLMGILMLNMCCLAFCCKETEGDPFNCPDGDSDVEHVLPCLLHGKEWLLYGKKCLLYGKEWLLHGKKCLLYGKECFLHGEKSCCCRKCCTADFRK